MASTAGRVNVARSILVLVVFSSGCGRGEDRPEHGAAGGRPAQASVPERSAGWVTHKDDAGFCLDTPPGWKVSADAKTGRITAQGRHSERVILWPVSAAERLDARGAGTIVRQLAQVLDDDLPWGDPEVEGNTARVSARGRQRSGVTALVWATSPKGAALTVCSVVAPSSLYESSVDTFDEILRSFRVAAQTEATGGEETGRAATRQAIPRMVTWSDPQEDAFSVLVPQGWRVFGGTYRMSATDTRHYVILLSPDGEVRVTLGDPRIGGYTVPTPMLAQVGFYEGGYQPLNDGSQLEISRYHTGSQFAQGWIQTVLPEGWRDLRVVASNDRRDLATSCVQQLRSDGLRNVQASGGDITVSGVLNGHEVVGYLAAVTDVPFPPQGPLWYVYRIYGYLAPPERQEEAESICRQLAQSMAFKTEWRAQQRQISANAVQQDNIRSQQIRRKALEAIAENQRQTSDLIAKSYWNKQKTYDEISRKRSNATLGTVDVVDPVGGTQYKIGYTSDYHWMDDQGRIASTSSDTTPGVGWRKLINLP